MPDLPEHPSLEHLRKQAKARKRQGQIPLSRAQHELAREYGFASWPKLVHEIQARGLVGVERALVLADAPSLAEHLSAAPEAATAAIDGRPALTVLLHRATGSPAAVRDCARLLLDAGADPDSHTIEWDGEGRMSALFHAVERGDRALVELLLARGASADEDAFYHACEQSDTALLDLLYRPPSGYDRMVNHKLDFEDAPGLRWFLDKGVDVNAHCALHHAICRGRSAQIITMLLDAGADPNLPWDRWDRGRRPLALAARCAHLEAYELLRSRGASADLDAVDAAVLAVARGESVRLPTAPAPALGIPPGEDTGGSWASWRCSGARTSCARCSTAACPSTPAAGATSPRSIRPRCTDAPTPSGCSSSAAPTCTTAPSTTRGRRHLTARSGACATTAPRTATIRAPCGCCWPPARPPARPRRRATPPWTRS